VAGYRRWGLEAAVVETPASLFLRNRLLLCRELSTRSLSAGAVRRVRRRQAARPGKMVEPAGSRVSAPCWGSRLVAEGQEVTLPPALVVLRAAWGLAVDLTEPMPVGSPWVVTAALVVLARSVRPVVAVARVRVLVVPVVLVVVLAVAAVAVVRGMAPVAALLTVALGVPDFLAF